MSELDELSRHASARVGTVLKDKWTIDRLIGVGGMASVYAATHRNQKRVAIKMLHAELSSSAEVRTRFLREGYAANTVGHRGAVAVDDEDVAEDGSAFLVMELLEGETLEGRRTRKGGQLAAEEVLSLMDQLLDVLAAAHEKGIVHRDLKPENLFFTQEGVLKVLDFGIARLRDGSAGGAVAGSGATRVGSVMGTPAFMAPEQARARWEMVDGQTDIWAVGATMFTLLSGRFVREAETINEELALAITTHAPSIATLLPDLPREVVGVVDTALVYDKASRWPDARAMQAVVRQAYHGLQGTGGTGTTTGGGQAPRRFLPSMTDPAEAASQAPSTLTTAVGATSLPQASAPAARGKAALVIGGGAALALIAAVFVVRGVAGGSPASASSEPSAPAKAATAVQVTTAAAPSASEAQPSASAAEPPSSASPIDTGAPADKPAAADKRAPKATKPLVPAAPVKAKAPAGKPDPFSRRN